MHLLRPSNGGSVWQMFYAPEIAVFRANVVGQKAQYHVAAHLGKIAFQGRGRDKGVVALIGQIQGACPEALLRRLLRPGRHAVI